MRRKNLIIMLAAATLLTACAKPVADEEAAGQSARTSVTVTHAISGHLTDTLEVTATTLYLKKSVLTAPIASYVVQAAVQTGSRVKRGETLFTLESKEHQALGATAEKGLGVIRVKAQTAGIVTSVDQQAGCYVTEGAALCTIADGGSMIFSLNVPTEQLRSFSSGRHCSITLPGGQQYEATLGAPLATMDEMEQVVHVPARARMPFLPEGFTAKVRMPASASGSIKQLLPSDAVQADETMTHFWVFSVMPGDSTVRKISVTTGVHNNRYIEIISPRFRPTDRIVVTGAYGLDDQSKVSIAKD